MRALAYRLCLTVINIFFPPLSVMMLAGVGWDFMMNCCLLLLAVIPAHIHGFYISCTYFHRRKKVKKGKYPGGPKPLIESPNIINGGASAAEVERLWRQENGLERKSSRRNEGMKRSSSTRPEMAQRQTSNQVPHRQRSNQLPQRQPSSQIRRNESNSGYGIPQRQPSNQIRRHESNGYALPQRLPSNQMRRNDANAFAPSGMQRQQSNPRRPDTDRRRVSSQNSRPGAYRRPTQEHMNIDGYGSGELYSPMSPQGSQMARGMFDRQTRQAEHW